MKLYQQKHRFLSMFLVFAMLITLVPMDAAAGTAGTIHGAAETIEVGSDVITSRENKFNKGWKFNLGDNNSFSNANFNDSAWDTVNLPHDFSIFQDFTSSGEAESGFLPGGTGWYRKSFVLPEEYQGKSILLNLY